MMIYLLISLLLLFFRGISSYQQEPAKQPCIPKSISKSELHAFIGWPYKIRFDLFCKGDEYAGISELCKEFRYKEKLLCLIRTDDDTVILNETATFITLSEINMILPDLYPENSTTFVLELHAPRINKCLSMKLQLNLTLFQSSNWRNLFVLKSKVNLGNQFNFECTEHPSLVPRLQNCCGMEYSWRKNTSELPIVGATKRYTVSSVTWEDEGVYICSVTYKGMTRDILVQSVKVKCPSVSLTPTPTLTCSSEILLRNEGNDAKITCQGIIGTGVPTKWNFRYSWSKIFTNGSAITKRKCWHLSKSLNNQHVSCAYEIEKSKVNCNVSNAVVLLHFNIKNITIEDFGKYFLELQTVLNGSPRASASFVLQHNPAPDLITHISIILACIGLLCLTLVSIGIVCCHMPRIKVLMKRHFGAYEKDDKDYGAYFAYKFSREFDTFYQEQVKRSVDMTRTVLEGMGYKVYDENKDGCHQFYKANNFQWEIERSHRVVIFLSFEYIKDDWSLRMLHQGLNETIKNSKSKIIFILFPGISEHLRQHYLHDVTCFMIRRSMQLNYVIKWSNKNDFNKKKFKLQLEDAMPKLKSQKLKRLLSSSDSDSYVPDYKDVSFHRCFSTDTNVTAVDFANASLEKVTLEIGGNSLKPLPTALV